MQTENQRLWDVDSSRPVGPGGPKENGVWKRLLMKRLARITSGHSFLSASSLHFSSNWTMAPIAY